MSKKLNYQLGFDLIRKINQAEALPKIHFILANDSWHLFAQFQAVILSTNKLGKFKVSTISSLIEPNAQSSFSLWAEHVAEDIAKMDAFSTAPYLLLTSENFSHFSKEHWGDYWPQHICAIPAFDAQKACMGMSLFARETPFSEEEALLLASIANTAANKTLSLVHTWKSKWTLGKRTKQVLLALFAASLIPTKMSVSAPGEIIALHAKIVASPIEGTVERFHVSQNEYVEKGTVLFSLDDELLQAQLQIAQNAYQGAQADLVAAQQKALVSEENRAEIATLEARALEKQAQVQQAQKALEYSQVKALESGYFIYSDENDWIGKPVAMGEKIGQIAAKDDLAVRIYVPADNAVEIDKGAQISVSLNIAPLTNIKGTIDTLSFAPTLSPDNIVSYKLRGTMEPNEEARIGYRANVKVYGARAPILYQILRRPIGYVRLWLGI